jgi:hypothetical protein
MSTAPIGTTRSPGAVGSRRLRPLDQPALLVLVALAVGLLIVVFAISFAIGRLTRPLDAGPQAPTAAKLTVVSAVVPIPGRLTAVPPIPSLAAHTQAQAAPTFAASAPAETHVSTATTSPTISPTSPQSPAPAPATTPTGSGGGSGSSSAAGGSTGGGSSGGSAGHSSSGGGSAGGSFDSSG